MSWLLLPGLAIVLGMIVVVLLQRRSELQAMSVRLADLAEAQRSGAQKARLQYPHIDLSRCIGCGTCVKACPEGDILGLLHGQAVVVHGAKCVGHGLCAEACPVGAIDLALGDLQNRTDIPLLTEEFESPDQPGLFLAGEVTGYALIRTAISHGTTIADAVATRVRGANGRARVKHDADGILDLCIVGAGPAGLAASLQSKKHGLDFVTLEQEGLGGTVSKYPRRKLVMTQPVTLPLHGQLKRASYSKEELMELWASVVREHELPIRSGEQFVELRRDAVGSFVVRTQNREYRARCVCLALGRRGTPRKLGVPGEDLPKVAYGLVDAQSYTGRRIVVVGGGDSAVEAALGLAEQPGNRVTLSYRQSAFSRIKARNQSRLDEALSRGLLECLLQTEVVEIGPDSVSLRGGTAGQSGTIRIDNDEVFILAGGTPPFELLQKSGVSFDPSRRPPPPPLAERGTGLIFAALAALLFTLVAAAWVWGHRGYYALARALRPEHPLHEALKPAGAIGLACGVGATGLILLNLCYLWRRSRIGQWLPGSLHAWMTSHVATGVLALLLVVVHGAMAPQSTVGGHAFLALVALVVTGAVGRYFYSYVPRAANGRELALGELNAALNSEAEQWDRYGRGFGGSIQAEIQELVEAGRWQTSFAGRLFALSGAKSRLRALVERIRREGKNEGLSPDQVERLVLLAKRTWRTALVASHFEDLRGILVSWRFFHRWLALLMVLLAAAHVAAAIRYGRILP